MKKILIMSLLLLANFVSTSKEGAWAEMEKDINAGETSQEITRTLSLSQPSAADENRILAQQQLKEAIAKREELLNSATVAKTGILLSEIILLSNAEFIENEESINIFSSITAEGKERIFKLYNHHIIRQANDAQAFKALEQLKATIAVNQEALIACQKSLAEINNLMKQDDDTLDAKMHYQKQIRTLNANIATLTIAKFQGIYHDTTNNFPVFSFKRIDRPLCIFKLCEGFADLFRISFQQN